MKPQVIIIGRPNVGKSTLFNRLVGKKLALVDDQPGVTRDRRMGNAEVAGMAFTVVDTAGWEDEDADTLPGRMRAQTEVSLEGADAALFVIDARAGITPLDEEIARWLREQDIPVVLVANKAEGRAGASSRGIRHPAWYGLRTALMPLPYREEIPRLECTNQVASQIASQTMKAEKAGRPRWCLSRGSRHLAWHKLDDDNGVHVGVQGLALSIGKLSVSDTYCCLNVCIRVAGCQL